MEEAGSLRWFCHFRVIPVFTVSVSNASVSCLLHSCWHTAGVFARSSARSWQMYEEEMDGIDDEAAGGAAGKSRSSPKQNFRLQSVSLPSALCPMCLCAILDSFRR